MVDNESVMVRFFRRGTRRLILLCCGRVAGSYFFMVFVDGKFVVGADERQACYR